MVIVVSEFYEAPKCATIFTRSLNTVTCLVEKEVFCAYHTSQCMWHHRNVRALYTDVPLMTPWIPGVNYVTSNLLKTMSCSRIHIVGVSYFFIDIYILVKNFNLSISQIESKIKKKNNKNTWSVFLTLFLESSCPNVRLMETKNFTTQGNSGWLLIRWNAFPQ